MINLKVVKSRGVLVTETDTSWQSEGRGRASSGRTYVLRGKKTACVVTCLRVGGGLNLMDAEDAADLIESQSVRPERSESR